MTILDAYAVLALLKGEAAAGEVQLLARIRGSNPALSDRKDQTAKGSPRPRKTFLVRSHSSMPARPPSRPKPLAL